MSKRAIAAVALRLYPDDVREIRGQEILATLLDAGAASSTAFAWELLSLIVAGLLSRSRRALTQPVGMLAANAICWAAVIAIMRIPFGVGVDLIKAPISIPPITVLDVYVLPLAILALFTLGARRLTGVAGLFWLAFFVKENPQIFLPHLVSEWSDMLVLPGLGFGLMTLWPQATPRKARTLWLIPAAAWGLMHLTVVILWGPGILPTMLIPIATALAFVPLAPAFAIGSAIAWSAPYITAPTNSNGTLILFCCAPLALLLVAAARNATRYTAHR